MKASDTNNENFISLPLDKNGEWFLKLARKTVHYVLSSPWFSSREYSKIENVLVLLEKFPRIPIGADYRLHLSTFSIDQTGKVNNPRMKTTFSIGVSDYALFLSLHETAYKHFYREDQVIGYFDSSTDSPWGNVPAKSNSWLIDTLYTILDDRKLMATIDNFSLPSVDKFITNSKRKSPITPVCDEVYFKRLRE